MDLFLDILMKITLPIVALAAIGYLVQGRLKLDVASLNRLQVYIILPAFLVHFLSTGSQSLSVVWPTAYFWVTQFIILIPLGWLLVLMFGMRRSYGPIVGIATAYANVGFFGIPLVQLAFTPDFIIHQSIITALTTILVATVGIWMLAPSGEQKGLMGRLKIAFDTPMIPAVVAGLLLRGFEVKLPPIAGVPIEMLSRVFTPLALFTLGAQLYESAFTRVPIGALSLMLILKLLVSPAFTWALGYYMGFAPDMIALFVVAAATPTGVLISIFARQYNTHPELITSAIVVSTVLSPLVITAWILATRVLM
jgi:malate permease and related proteins